MEDVGWINALVSEENVYPDLVKVFYLNMDASAEKENRVITNIGGVSIEFDDSKLNSILGTSDNGLEIFSPRKSPDIDDYVHIDTVTNICHRIDLFDMIVPPISALNVFVFKLKYYSALFILLCFLDQAIWMRFPIWMLALLIVFLNVVQLT